MNLTLDERTKIFDKVCHLVLKKHFDPGMNGVDWNALAQSRREQILASSDPAAFEKEVHKLVAELKTSHTGFRHALACRDDESKAPRLKTSGSSCGAADGSAASSLRDC